jgi:tetratricopeptide (TPR) repeat protein
MITRCLVTLILVALAGRASAQQATFTQALFELTSAIEGTYGDEGARVLPALEKMSFALVEWDREIEAADRSLRAPATGSEKDMFQRHLALGRMYAYRGNPTRALTELAAASRLEPRQPDVHVLGGLVLSASLEDRDAIEEFRTARQLDPDNTVLAYYLFQSASRLGDAKVSQEAAGVLAAAYPKLVKEAGLGRVKADRAPFASIALLQPAAGAPPVLPPAVYRRGYWHLARGEYAAAITEFRKAAAIDPLTSDPAAASPVLTRAVAALRQGRLAEARAALEQSGAMKDSSEAHRVLGLAYWADSQYDSSVRELEESIRLSPRNERARLALSRVLASAGNDAEAENALQETLRAVPESALAHWWLASAFERVNRFNDAWEKYEIAASAAVTGESQLHAAVGRFASAAADLPGAISAFSRAVTAQPNDPALHRLLAGALMQQDRSDEAFAEFIAALLINPQDGEAHAGIGQIHLNAGRDADAVEALRRAAEISPDNSQTRYALANALVRVGRRDEAAQHFARVEQAQRQILADRRRTMSYDVLKEEAALRVAEGRLDAAIALYEQALSLRAEAAVYGRLADLYSRVGRAPDAARAKAMYEKALLAGSAAR